MLEKRLQGTPVQPKQEFIRASVEVNYRQSDYEFPGEEEDLNLDWEELEIIPMVSYERNRDLDLPHGFSRSPGVAGHIGLVFTQADGSLGSASLDAAADISLLLQADWRLESGWRTYLRAIVSGDDDQRIGIGAGRNF